MTTFEPFPKIPRLSRECIVTEKIDGTNASVWILDVDTSEDLIVVPEEAKFVTVGTHEFAVVAASRNRFITPDKDNAGFGRWVHEHAEELAVELGYGTHFGEWWGSGIQRKYGLENGEKRFSLFNTGVWKGDNDFGLGSMYGSSMERMTDRVRPSLCHVVPVLYQGMFDTASIRVVVNRLRTEGSQAAPGFMNPEGVMIFHTKSRGYFKKTCDQDEQGKWEQ